MAVRQEGTRIRLSWTAPSRNTDGTTEKLELAEVEIRRQVVDINALVEEQTRPFELPQDDETEDEDTGDLLEGDIEDPGTPADPETPPEVVPAEPEPSPVEPAEPDEPVVDQSLPAVEGLTEAGELAEGEDLKDSRLRIPATPALVVPNFAPESRPVATMTSIEPGAPMSFEEDIDPSWIGKRVSYAVIYTNQRNRRGPRSPVVQIEPVVALPVPLQPAVEARDGYVLVTWAAGVPSIVVAPEPEPELAPEPSPGAEESSDIEEELPTGPFFSVFRRAANVPDYPVNPIHAVPVTQTEFRDSAVAFDVESCYVIREVAAPPPAPVIEPEIDPLDTLTDTLEQSVPEDVAAAAADLQAPAGQADLAVPTDLADAAVPTVQTDEPLGSEDAAALEAPIEIPEFIVPSIPPLTNTAKIESDPSDEVCLTPVDVFALPAPVGLVAVSSESSVLLTWNDVEQDELSGYRVYRRESDQADFELLGEVVVPSFTDAGVAAGTTYFYVVTALDDAAQVNESPRGAPAEVRFEPP